MANKKMQAIDEQERLDLGLPSRESVAQNTQKQKEWEAAQPSEAVKKSEEILAEDKAAKKKFLLNQKDNLGSLLRYLNAVGSLRKEYDNDVDGIRSNVNVVRYVPNEEEGSDYFEWIPEDQVKDGDITYKSTNQLMSQILDDYGIQQSDYARTVAPLMNTIYGKSYPYTVAPPVIDTMLDAVAPRTAARAMDDELHERYGIAGPIALDIGENVALGALGYAGPKAAARVAESAARNFGTARKVLNAAPRLAPALINGGIQAAGNAGVRSAGMLVDEARGMGDNVPWNLPDVAAEAATAGLIGAGFDAVFPSTETKVRKNLWRGTGDKREKVSRHYINGKDVGPAIDGPWAIPEDIVKPAVDVYKGGEGADDLQSIAQNAYKKYGFGDDTYVQTKPLNLKGIDFDENGKPSMVNFDAFARANDLDAGVGSADIEKIGKAVENTFNHPSSYEHQALLSGQPRPMKSGKSKGYDRTVGYSEQMSKLHDSNEPFADYVRRNTIPVGSHSGMDLPWQLATDEYGKRWDIIKSNKNRISNKSVTRPVNILDTRRPIPKAVAAGAKLAIPVVKHDAAHAFPWDFITGDKNDSANAEQ